MSKTNKAFERYLGQAEDDDILSIYRKEAELIHIIKIDTGLIPLFVGAKCFIHILLDMSIIFTRLV